MASCGSASCGLGRGRGRGRSGGLSASRLGWRGADCERRATTAPRRRTYDEYTVSTSISARGLPPSARGGGDVKSQLRLLKAKMRRDSVSKQQQRRPATSHHRSGGERNECMAMKGGLRVTAGDSWGDTEAKLQAWPECAPPPPAARRPEHAQRRSRSGGGDTRVTECTRKAGCGCTACRAAEQGMPSEVLLGAQQLEACPHCARKFNPRARA